MARRPTRTAAPAAPGPAAGPANGVMASIPTLSSAQPIGVRTGFTGRYLVSMQPTERKAAIDALKSGAGISVTSIAGADIRDAGPVGLGDGLVFHDLGVALVHAAPDQVTAMSNTVASAASLKIVEPERWVHTSGPMLDAAYLRGYRDAIDHLAGQMLGGEGAAAVKAAGVGFFDEDSLTWGLQAVGVPASRMTGKGIKVAVLDTGLDLNHPDFIGRVPTTQLMATVTGATSAQDGHGHGTHCAGVVAGPAQPSQLPRYGIAPDATLYVGKVLNDAGSGTDGDILAGIQFALAQRCDIISMSLGGPVEVGAAFSQIFEQVAKIALSHECVIVAAAGNDSRRPDSVRPVSHPANCPSIFAVAALDRNLGPAFFSNAGLNPDGGQIDIAAPGVDVISSWPMPETYKTESGTSMATPHVAGLAALLAEANPGVRGQALFALLTQTAKRSMASSVDVGAGLAQAP